MLQTLVHRSQDTIAPPGRDSPEHSASSSWASTGGQVVVYGTTTPTDTLALCPSRSFWVVCDTDPSKRSPASCDSYRCPVCGPRKVRATADVAAYSLSLPEARQPRFLTLHDAPSTHAQRVRKMRNLRASLTKDQIVWEAAWSAERYGDVGFHIHAIVHGPTLSLQALQDRVARTWGGRVHASPMRNPRAATHYAVKTFLIDPKDALDLNGRPLHTTSGFHHGLTKREAAREMRAALAEGEVFDWHLELPAIQVA